MSTATPPPDGWDNARPNYELAEMMFKNRIDWPSNPRQDVLVQLLQQKGLEPKDIPTGLTEPFEKRWPQDKDEMSMGQPDLSEPLSEKEKDFLFSQEGEQHFPVINALDDNDRTKFIEYSETVKGKFPDIPLIEFWYYAEVILSSVGSQGIQDRRIEEYLNNPVDYDQWKYGTDSDTDFSIHDRNFNAVQAMFGRTQRSRVKVQLTLPTGDPATELDDDQHSVPYDSQERRKLRWKYHGAGNPDANKMTVEDPEDGRKVEADILGRHPMRKTWLAVALPSRNNDNPLLSRGYYIKGSDDRYKEAFENYAVDGANVTLSVATEKAQLEGCEPAEFELNLVLVMPWGKGFQYAGYGIAHYRKDKDFMLHSKTLLAKEWTQTRTMDILHDHMIKCGQSIPRTGEKDMRLKAKSWRK